MHYPLRSILLVVAASVLAFLAATILNPYVYLALSPELYLSIHSLLEIAAIVVGFSIFALNWNASLQDDEPLWNIIGTGFLAVALLDTMHLFSFSGAPNSITPSATDKGIWYRLASSFWVVGLLVAANLVSASRTRLLRRGPLLVLNLAVAGIVFVVVSFQYSFLPSIFMEGQGATALKAGLELGVVALSVAGAALYASRYRATGDRLAEMLAIALVVTAFGNLYLALYAYAYDSYNLFAHIYKVIAYYLIFSALFVSAVQRPQQQLARLNNQIENELKRTIARLEASTRAERRTRERAEAAIEMLRPLQTVTEAALSNRALDDLLRELLERVSKALAADTATILLLTDDGLELIARASFGLEEEVRERIRIPIGQGIAGGVAARREPVIVNDLSKERVANPILRRNVRSLIAAPLLVRGRVIGVIHAGTASLRHFTDEELRLLRLVAEGVASAIERARLYGELEATVMSMAHGVIVYNPDGKIARMNPAAERIFAYSPEELKLPVSERLGLLRMETEAGKTIPVGQSPLYRALRGETVQSELMVIHRPPNRTIWISTSAAPIRIAEGENLGAVVSFSDVTALHEMQEQRAQHVLAISHGLRTPLTVIQGQAQLLQRTIKGTGFNGREQRSADAIVTQSLRMSLTLKDLVDLTHLEAGQKLSLNRVPVEMHSFMLELKERLATVLQTERLQVEDSKGLPAVMADPDRLERILVNLLSNALKYSSPGTPVTVCIEAAGAEVITTVSDRGPGVPKELLPHLFQGQGRVRVHQRPNTLGLGLYITEGLVEAHGGRIWVQSSAGQGSDFSFALPVAAPRSPATRTP